MRKQCLARRAVNHYLQSWQMLCHVGSLNQHAASLCLDPAQAEILVLEAGTSKWNFVSDYIIILSSWSLKSRGMFDQSVRTDCQSTRDAAWSNRDKKSAYACTVLTFTLRVPHFPTDTSNQSLHPPRVDFPRIYVKSLTVLKTCLKKSMSPFIFFSRRSFTSGEN